MVYGIIFYFCLYTVTRRHVRELEYKETLRARLRMLTEDDAIETFVLSGLHNAYDDNQQMTVL